MKSGLCRSGQPGRWSLDRVVLTFTLDCIILTVYLMNPNILGANVFQAVDIRAAINRRDVVQVFV